MEPINLLSTNPGIYVYRLWLTCVIIFRLRSVRICYDSLRLFFCGLDVHRFSFTRNTRLILDWRYILTKTNPQVSGAESCFISWQSRYWQVILPLRGTRISEYPTASSREPVTGPYPESNESSAHLRTLFLEGPFN